MLKENKDISNIIQQVLSHRDKNGSSRINDFLNPTYEQIQHTYRHFISIDEVVGRINKAIEKDEKITIYGDFDADGLTASAIVTEFFKVVGYRNYDVYIPDRLTAGHGLQNDVIERLIYKGTKLIITVDCGITDIEQIEKAKKLNADVIVTDHHLPGEEMPACLTLTPPKSLGTPYSGAGIAFKLVQALLSDHEFSDLVRSKLLQLAMLGTVVDAVPQIGENRAISRLGFNEMISTPFTGLSSMITHLGLEDIRSEDITFSIAPRLSAPGRMGHPTLAYDFLVTDDIMDAFALQGQLTELNNRRKQLVKKTLDNIKVDASKPTVIGVVDKEAKGITGIVASRLVSKYDKPAFVCSRGEDGYLQCSARSGGFCDLSDALKFVNRVIESGGGHKHAGGAIVTEENYHDFAMLLNTFMRQENKIDSNSKSIRSDGVSLPINLVGEQLAEGLKKLEPYGPDGPPVFRSYVTVKQVKLIGKEKDHLDMIVQCNESKKEIRVVGWNMKHLYYSVERRNRLDPLEIRYTINRNEFRGQTRYELYLIDVDFHGTEIPF